MNKPYCHFKTCTFNVTAFSIPKFYVSVKAVNLTGTAFIAKVLSLFQKLDFQSNGKNC